METKYKSTQENFFSKNKFLTLQYKIGMKKSSGLEILDRNSFSYLFSN
jgi:hypothetical protein